MSRIEPVQSYLGADGQLLKTKQKKHTNLHHYIYFEDLASEIDKEFKFITLAIELVLYHALVLNWCLSEESDYATEYEEDGMDTVREEEGEEEEEEEAEEDPEDQSPGEWEPNGIFTSVSVHTQPFI